MAEEAECEELLQQLVSGKHATVTGGLILKLEQFLKKPAIEVGLSEVLIQYLEHLRTSRIYLSSGVFTINFAECALLLQSASNLYAKKVDLLWDSIIAYQERNVLYEERSEKTENEFKKVEERKERFKRKRKKKELEAPTQQEPESIPLSADMMYDTIMKQSLDLTDDLFARLKEEPMDQPLEPYFDYFNNWYTYDNITQKLNRCPLLMKDIEKVKKSKRFKRRNFFEENLLFNIPIKELNEDGDEETLFQYSELTLNYLYREDSEDLENLKKRMESPRDSYRPVYAMEYCLQLFLSFYKIPMETIYKEYDRFLMFYKDFLSTLPPPDEVLPATMMAAVTVSNPKPVEPVLEENPVAKQGEGESDCDIRAEEDTSKLNRQDPIRKTTESSDSGFFDGEGECHGSEMDKSTNLETTPNTPQISASWEPDYLNVPDVHDSESVHSEHQSPNITIEEEFIEQCKPVKKRKIDVDEEGKFQEIIKPKRQRKQVFKLRPTHTTTLKKFEMFFNTNYEPAAGEGTIIPVDYPDSEDELDNFDPPTNDENFLTPADPSPENNAGVQLEASNQQNSNPQCDTPVVTEKNSNPANDDEEDEDDSEQQFLNYLTWKEFIENKIKTQAEVQFDIHNEGTAIIENIGTIGKSVHYKEICGGKSSDEVTRSFIAMLQLANTYNVEIMNATGGTLANDTLELKLLSKERHHENLYEYQAPSEVTFKDRLKNAKRAAISQSNNFLPQQGTVRTYKKIRLG